MTYYYAHPESGCAFLSDDPPDVVMTDPCVELLDRRQYERFCKQAGIEIEPHPDPCPETQRRVRLSVAAWAYEVHDDPLMSDAEYDTLSRGVDPMRSTMRSDLDEFFVREFSPDTGIWIHRHPEPDKLEAAYQRLRAQPMISLLEWIMLP